jgi:hAT family C-terminal dimerisation region
MNEKHHASYPAIARIARDRHLAASTEVERLSSRGKRVCTEFRGSLSGSSVARAMCIKAWLSQGVKLLKNGPSLRHGSKSS